MIRLLIFLLFFATSAQAQGVLVKSGEHGPFTRLVLTFPSPVEWVLGRTPDGYGLHLQRARMTYDLSSVYALITKERLKSIWADPESGDLLLGLDCDCHAIPFELTSRILVIDLKDGPAPENSSFELSLIDGSLSPPIKPIAPPRPKTKSDAGKNYDWLAQTTGQRVPLAQNTPQPSAPTDKDPTGLESDLRLDAFRTLLVKEVSRGATQRLVEMAAPSARAPSAPTAADEPSAPAPPAQARTALQDLPGVDVSTDQEQRPPLTVRGETCPGTANLDIGSWADPDDGATALTSAGANLLSEFDVPDPGRVLQAVNLHLYFGFGAEARLLLTNFLPAGQNDPYRLAVSYILDDEDPRQNPFRDMQTCDSAAALWSLLSAPPGETLAFVNGAAASRTFLALPKHLRSSLGPETAKRLLRSGDSANAEVVKQSFERTVPTDDPTRNLLEADQTLQAGDPAGAEAFLPENASGETALAALFTLVESRFQQRLAVEAQDVLALESFAFEHGNGPLKPKIDRALAHASALAGDFRAAFGHAAASPMLTRDIWSLLAELGAESAVLAFAVGLEAAQRDALPSAVRSKMADRLLRAGLPNAALDWTKSPETDPQLAARVALANGDARTALQHLSSQSPGADSALMASAYAALQEFDAASTLLRQAGKTGDADRMQRWTGTWAAETAAENDPWKIVADLIDPDATIETLPPLQASESHLAQSQTTRAAIADLLTQTATEAVPTP